MNVRKLLPMALLVRFSLAVIVLLLAIGAPSASAQIEIYTPPADSATGTDWTEKILEILPEGVESRAEARVRIASYIPDPVSYPVPRTLWDGKPDLSGVYWPDAMNASASVQLESLYRPEVREYREAGGAATALIDWRDARQSSWVWK